MAESITSEGAVPTLADRRTFQELVSIPISAAVNARLAGLFVRVETQVNRNPLDDTLEIRVAATRDDGVIIWGLEVVSDRSVEYYAKDSGFFDSLASSLANRITKEAAKTPRRQALRGPSRVARRLEEETYSQEWTKEYVDQGGPIVEDPSVVEAKKQARLKRELEDNDIVRNESEERYALLELDLNNDKDSNKP